MSVPKEFTHNAVHAHLINHLQAGGRPIVISSKCTISKSCKLKCLKHFLNPGYDSRLQSIDRSNLSINRRIGTTARNKPSKSQCSDFYLRSSLQIKRYAFSSLYVPCRAQRSNVSENTMTVQSSISWQHQNDCTTLITGLYLMLNFPILFRVSRGPAVRTRDFKRLRPQNPQGIAANLPGLNSILTFCFFFPPQNNKLPRRQWRYFSRQTFTVVKNSCIWVIFLT